MTPFKIFNRRRIPPVSINVPSGTYTHSVIDPADATVTLEFQPDGECALSAGVIGGPVANWGSGLGFTSGADYEISFDGGGSWQDISANRDITVSRTVIGTTTLTPDIRIRRLSDGVALGAGTPTLEAIVDA